MASCCLGKDEATGVFLHTARPHIGEHQERGQPSHPAMRLGGKGTNNMQYLETITEGQTRLLNLTTPTTEFL